VSAAAPVPAPPERIGKYPVVRELGRGASSIVYLCHDPFNSRDVAVKLVMPETFQSKDKAGLYRKLFITEASLAGRLQHPHICQIYDAVADEGQQYIVMEYVGGGTLEHHGDAQDLLPLDRLVEIVFKCTRALEFAHKMGITHRDLKPANILYTGETDVKITDFGAALIASGEVTQISAIGSPAYMSPEQVKEHPLDHRTDIYSLGVVLYQLLAGRLPFQGTNNFSLIYQIANVEPQPPSAYRPQIPASLDAIVKRAMAKDLAGRYARWEDFSLDLAEVFRNEHLGVKRDTFADSDKFETLRKLPFFGNFTDAELWEVARISHWRTAGAGEVLMKEGEPGNFFCILADGEVRVSRKGRTLNLLQAGECFGEMAYLAKDEQLRGADVTVTRESRIISVPTQKLAQASEACRHKFDRAFMEILVERLTLANARLAGV
jgi:serine/threonine protein kinase